MKSLLSAARKALDSSDYQKAIECCNEVIEQDPDNYNAHLFKGFAFSKTGKEEAAVKEFEIAVSLNPESPLAFQGLIAVTQNNPSRLISYYKQLAQLHSKDQPQKYYDDLIKMVDIYKTLNDYESIITVWEKMLQRSPEYNFLKDYIQFSAVEIWGFILQTAMEKDNYDYDKEWQVQKYRIQSKAMDLVKKDIEKQVNLKSKVGEAIENVLIRIQKDKTYYDLSNQLVTFLYKRLEFTENEAHKEKILERIFQLCNVFHSFTDYESVYIEPFNIEFELMDYKIDEYDLEIIKKIAAVTKDTRFGINCSLINAIRNGSKDVKDLMGETNISDNADFFTCQVMAFSCTSVRFDEQALEWGQRAQLMLENLFQISGNPYNKRSEELKYLLASVLSRLGGSYLAEALSIYRQLLEKNPSSHGALLGISDIYIRLQNWNKAAEYADKCLESDENDHQALAARGWVAFHQNNMDLALKSIKKANNICRDAVYLYRLGRIYWEMGGDYKSGKDYALSHFLQAAKEKPNYAPPFCYLGFYYDQVEHDSTRAMKCFQKSIQLDPINSESNKALIMLKMAANKQAEAIEILQAYCDQSPRNDWAHKVLGDLLINSAKYADAIFHFNQSLRYDDKNSSIWTSLGQALSHEGKYVAASKAFQRAINVSHGQDEKLNILYLLSAVQLKLGDIPEAILILQNIIAVLPYHFPTRIKLLEAHIRLAHEKRQEGHYAEYKSTLENALVVSMDGFKYANRSVWLFRFVGRILTLFLKDNILCDSDIIHKLLMELKTFVKESDSKILDDYKLSFGSSSLGSLFECCVVSLIISVREASEFADLQAFCLYDLALCTYYGYVRQKDKIVILKKATQIIRLCIEILPDSSMFWNAAGVFLQTLDLARSQHCFIKAAYLASLEYPWINLVLLAIKNDDIQLSQELISHSLINNPENSKLWLAKSLISRSLHVNEFISILDHAFEVSDGQLPDVNFLHLEQCLQSDDSRSIENAVSNVHKAVDFVSDDVAYINLLAMAFERLGNYRKSLTLLNKAVHQESLSKYDDLETKVALTSNATRLLCTNSLYNSAMDIYQTIFDNETFQDPFNLIYLSLCYFKLERYEDCLKTMDAAIEKSTDTLIETELLITLGRIIFSIDEIDGNIEIAKEQFFKCITLDISVTGALFGLLAVSIVLNDSTIAESVLAELEKCQNYSTDIFYWIGAYHELIGDAKSARTNYLKSCHQFPTSISSWNHLLRFFLKTEPDSATFAFYNVGSILDSYSLHDNVDTYVENLYLKGLYFYCNGSIADSSKQLKKALHLQPQNPKILSALYLCQTSSDPGRLYVQKMIEILSDQGNKEAHALLTKIKVHFDRNTLQDAKFIITHLQNSTDNEANLHMSILFYYLSDFEKALNCVRNYLNSSSNVNALEILAAVCTKLKLWSEAESAHNLALDICSRPAEKVVIQYRILKHYMELGDHKSSSEALSKIYQIEGESSMQKLIQAILQKRNGNQNKCQKILDSIDSEYRKWSDLI